MPVPGGSPQTIDLAADPLLRFAHSPGPQLPLLDAIGFAVEHHPAVEVAVAEQQASESVRTQVRAALFPRADAQLLHNRVISRDFGKRIAIVESLQPAVRTDLSGTVDQLVFDFGATGNRISAANDRISAAKAEVERVASDTALRAAAAWYDVLDYETLNELSAAMIARQTDILRDVRTRVKQGVGAASDIARTEAVLADTRAQGSRYTRLLDQARSRFHEAFTVDPPVQLMRSLAPSSSAVSRDGAEALAARSPAVQVARRRAEAARHDYRAAKADGLPRLSAGINGARYDVFTASDYDLRGTIVLRQNLFGGGRQRGVIGQASAQARSAGYLADRISAESERDAGIAFTDLGALGTTAANLEVAYVANRRARDAYVEQFRVSRGTLIELLRAEQDFLSAATNYLQAIFELDVARFTLLARTGELLPAVGIQLSATAM